MDSEIRDTVHNGGILPNFNSAAEKAASALRVQHCRMVLKDRNTLTRKQFEEKYHGTEKYGEMVVTVDPAKRLDEAGYKREIAGADFDLLCRAFNTIFEIPNMGLLLTGGVGCGKTFGITSLVKGNLVRLTDKDDFLSLEPFVDSETGRVTWKHLYGETNVILDDLGNEPLKSEYGVKIDVVSDFILKWYTAKIEDCGKGRLFATTNLTGDQLIERYGDRVTDRLFSMVCVVKMTGNSKRRKPIVIQ